MDLDRNCWYVKLFFWSLGIVDEFCESDRVCRAERNGVNLCSFVRTILVYMPLILALHAAVFAAAIVSLTAFPVRLFGGWTYAWAVGAILFVALAVLAIKALDKRAQSRPYIEKIEEREPRPVAQKASRSGPSFFAVLWVYIVAVKKKICPIIVFTGVRP